MELHCPWISEVIIIMTSAEKNRVNDHRKYWLREFCSQKVKIIMTPWGFPTRYDHAHCSTRRLLSRSLIDDNPLSPLNSRVRLLVSFSADKSLRQKFLERGWALFSKEGDTNRGWYDEGDRPSLYTMIVLQSFNSSFVFPHWATMKETG